ncbi:MAG: ATP phosphoribosyltransferase [Actinomycetota bacterium]|nr:ATP phosphoribosyltransferase [Actinomycetota bacterium]
MLRVAVPNKGMLAEPAALMLRESGYRQRASSSELATLDPDNDAEFFYLRPRDVAVYVGSGTVDVGITGRDMLLDAQAEADELLALDFGHSTFRFAAPEDGPSTVAELAGRRVATAYPGLLAKYLAELGVAAEVIGLDGAVETACRLGVADAVADVVSTGTTLRTAGLSVIGGPLLRSEAILIRRRSGTEENTAVTQLIRRLEGVLVARQYVLMDYDCPVEVLEAACEITPGLEGPTVSPLRKEGWVAVRSMVARADTNRVMDDLWRVGARAILVTDIHACRI